LKLPRNRPDEARLGGKPGTAFERVKNPCLSMEEIILSKTEDGIMNESVNKIAEALKAMGFRVVAAEDKTCMPYPVINISVVSEKWAEANYPK
jgi:hypothetical protein